MHRLVCGSRSAGINAYWRCKMELTLEAKLMIVQDARYRLSVFPKGFERDAGCLADAKRLLMIIDVYQKQIDSAVAADMEANDDNNCEDS